MELPQAFKDKMKRLLGEEYETFLESYDREREQGLRLNLLKTNPRRFEKESPFELKPVSWTEEGYYYGAKNRPGRHPYHEAGVYYIQEPSAMAVVSLLDPRPGDRVLDLCAAPGGKSSHIASRLRGKGFLLSNEIHPARAKILSQNIERMGIGNGAVTNEDSAALLSRFPEYFDKIVVDAPCSGEGMFRKDEGARAEWSLDHVALCAGRQAEILDHAAGMLRPGGVMAYSTCTFSPEEDEQAVEAFLKEHPEFQIIQTEKFPGLSEGVPEWSKQGLEALSHTVRIWPQRASGEGHFIAVLKKADGERTEHWKRSYPAYLKDRKLLQDYEIFLQETIADLEENEDSEDEISHFSRLKRGTEMVLFGEQLYLLAPELLSFEGLRVLRPGLHLGTLKKNRFEPSHALALWLRERDAIRFIRLSPESPRLTAYLKGESLSLSDLSESDAVMGGICSGKEKGWTLVTVKGEGEGYPVGWGKLSGGILKNHYPKGLRIQG